MPVAIRQKLKSHNARSRARPDNPEFCGMTPEPAEELLFDGQLDIPTYNVEIPARDILDSKYDWLGR